MAILQQCPICRRKQKTVNKRCSCGEDLDKAKRSNRVKFYIRWRLPGGKQKQEYVGTSIKDAVASEGKRTGQKKEGRVLEMLPESKMTFQELTDWFFGLAKIQPMPSTPIRKIYMKSFNTAFGGVPVGEIKTIDLEDYQAKRQAAGKADSYIDSEVKTAKTITIKAFDNDMIGAEPLKAFKRCKKLLKKHADARDRILLKEEFDGIMEHLPLHLQWIVATAYYTGMRKTEILNLTWDQVNMVNTFITLSAADTKDDEPRKVPIPEPLHNILASVPRAIHDNHLFLYRGKPVSDIRKGLVKACTKAGVVYGRYKKNGFVFHDLRHTYNTNMRKAGVPEGVIMKITGHSTREMFDRYNTVDEGDAVDATEKLEVFLASVDQTVDHEHKPKEKGTQPKR